MRQGGNEDEIENLVKEVESFTNKNEHIYRILVHYYKINNNEKFEKLLKLGRAFDESTKRYNLDSYLLFEGKFDEYMTAAEQAFKERKLGWGFWDQIGLNEYWDDPRLKAFMEQFWVRNAN